LLRGCSEPLNRLRLAASLWQLGSQRGARQGGGGGVCVRAAAGCSQGGAQETAPFIGARTPRSPWRARQERWRWRHGGFGLWLKSGLRWARTGRRLGRRVRVGRAAVWAKLGCGLQSSSGPAEKTRGRRWTSETWAATVCGPEKERRKEIPFYFHKAFSWKIK
jgi:hypothetical protein